MTDDVDAADQHAGDAPSRFSRTAFATRIAVGVAGCVALTGLAFAVDHANRPSRSFELTGQVSVTGAAATSDPSAGSGCTETGSGRVAPGTEVAVRGVADLPLATGRLDAGTAIGGGCTFGFSVAGVPRGLDDYRVTVGDLGGFTVSASQAEAGLLIFVAT